MVVGSVNRNLTRSQLSLDYNVNDDFAKSRGGGLEDRGGPTVILPGTQIATVGFNLDAIRTTTLSPKTSSSKIRAAPQANACALG